MLGLRDWGSQVFRWRSLSPQSSSSLPFLSPSKELNLRLACIFSLLSASREEPLAHSLTAAVSGLSE